nr:hypothetical protein [Nocardioides houyundeii]
MQLVDHAQGVGLRTGDHARGEEQVKRPGVADETGQQPGQPLLGDQPTAREAGAELGLAGGEAQVAGEREDQPDAGAGAVDDADHRLGDGAGDQELPARHLDLVAVAEPAEDLQVGAGAEAAPRPGEQDDPDLVVVRGLVQPGREALLHRRVHGVEPVGTVEGDDADAVLDGEGDRLGGGCGESRAGHV